MSVLTSVDAIAYDDLLDGLAGVVASLGASPAPLTADSSSDLHLYAAKLLTHFSVISLSEYNALMTAVSAFLPTPLHLVKHQSDTACKMVGEVYKLLCNIDRLTPAHALPIYYIIKGVLARTTLQSCNDSNDQAQQDPPSDQLSDALQQQIELLLARVWGQVNVQVALLSTYGGVEPLLQMLASEEPMNTWQLPY